MYKIQIYAKNESLPLLELETKNRNNARIVKLVCIENNLDCKVVQEVQPREVKFKGID